MDVAGDETPIETAGDSIHSAVRACDVEALRDLLENGNSPNAINKARETPLHVACRRTNQSNSTSESAAKLAIVQLLWEFGARINAKGGSRKETALAVAVDSQMVDLVDFLLKNGANPNSFDKDQRTPLHVACSVIVPGDDLSVAASSEAITRLLLLRGANFHARDSRSRTPLIEAVCYRNENLVLLLLEFGAQINYANRLGMTPLFYACESHNVSMVELLLRHQADVHARENRMRSTPLHLVAGKGRYRDPDDDSRSVACLLKQHGADVDARDAEGQTALHVACDTQDEILLETLLELGASLDLRDEYGNTGLHILLRNAQEKGGDETGLENIAKMLVKRGANVNELNNNSETPFLLSVYHGNPRVVFHFLENGADTRSLWYSHKSSLRYLHETPRCNTPDICGRDAEEAATLLNVAAVRGHLEVAEILMDYAKADVEMTSLCGTHDVVKTPLYFAVKNNHLEVAQLFLDAGCRINRPVLHNTSVLHVAVSKGNALLTYLLLEYGADSEMKDLHGKTALHYAFEHEHYLLEIIAKVLVKNRVKREYQGLRVNGEDAEIIRSRKWLEEFRLDCELELSRMRKDVVCDNLTLYSIFTKSVDALAVCLGNENVTEALVFNEIKKKYPIYYVTLRYHYQLASRRKELVDSATLALNILLQDIARSLGYGVMPSVVVQTILEFCSLRDLSKIKLIL